MAINDKNYLKEMFIDEARAVLPTGGSSSSGSAVKLYRHDLYLRSDYENLAEVYLTIYNSDPTNYSQNNEDFGENTPPQADVSAILACIPVGSRLMASGVGCTSSDGSAYDMAVTYVENRNNVLCAGGNGLNPEFSSEWIDYFPSESTDLRIEKIVDTVTEVH